MADPDQLFQNALNEINAVNLPDIEKMKVKLGQLVQMGLITPEQYQAALQDRNAYDQIANNPLYAAAQENALAQLQRVGEEGGLTAVDDAQLQDIKDEQNATARGRNEAVMQNLRERGVAGGGLELQAKLANEQDAADRASREGLDVAALAQQRALQAMMGAGEMASNMEQNDWQQQAAHAESQNAIDAANAQMTNQARQFNVTNNNAAQAANLGEKQRISDTNVGTGNEEKVYNSQLHQQQFENEMGKASAKAGIYNQWGNSEAQEQAQKKGFKNAITAGLIQTGANALSKGMAGNFQPAQPGSMQANGGSTDPYKRYASINSLPGAAHGELIDGEPVVPGDDPANDTELRRVSPGEAIIPRTVVDEPELMPEFVKGLKREKGMEPAPEVSPADIAKVFKALSMMSEGM